ncbi:MAG TPA: hypothetical protein DG757_23405 [Bacillus sp. (in: Bacteria)]|nr:hypothetical protein [Bacillus sp. (in: firmicutes)]
MSVDPRLTLVFVGDFKKKDSLVLEGEENFLNERAGYLTNTRLCEKKFEILIELNHRILKLFSAQAVLVSRESKVSHI